LLDTILSHFGHLILSTVRTKKAELNIHIPRSYYFRSIQDYFLVRRKIVNKPRKIRCLHRRLAYRLTLNNPHPVTKSSSNYLFYLFLDVSDANRCLICNFRLTINHEFLGYAFWMILFSSRPIFNNSPILVMAIESRSAMHVYYMGTIFTNRKLYVAMSCAEKELNTSKNKIFQTFTWRVAFPLLFFIFLV